MALLTVRVVKVTVEEPTSLLKRDKNSILNPVKDNQADQERFLPAQTSGSSTQTTYYSISSCSGYSQRCQLSPWHPPAPGWPFCICAGWVRRFPRSLRTAFCRPWVSCWGPRRLPGAEWCGVCRLLTRWRAPWGGESWYASPWRPRCGDGLLPQVRPLARGFCSGAWLALSCCLMCLLEDKVGFLWRVMIETRDFWKALNELVDLKIFFDWILAFFN